MSEWKEYNITDVCDTISDTYRDSAEKVVLINTSDVLEGKVTNHEFVPNKNLAGQFKKKFQKDDILYSEIRPANKRYAYVDFEPYNYIASTKLMVLRSKPCILPKYLYYLLTNNTTIRTLHAIAVGRSGTFPQITYSELANIKFKLPSIDEQKEILSTLLDFDDKIAVNKKICENLEAQAQALFKHWFVDFAPFKNGKFVESELGFIPEGWRVGKAEDFYTINIGKTPPRAERQWFSESKGNNKTWISISDMGSCGTFISDSKEYLTPEAQSKFNVVMVPVGTILLSFKLTIGRVAIADNELTTNEAIARFILPNSDYREFTYLYLKQYKYESLGSTSSIATAVNSKIIKSMPFLMPTTEVLDKFSTVVSKLFDEINILSNESSRLATLRDTLLPKLMSGQIKL